MRGVQLVLLSVLLYVPACLCVRDTKYYDILGISPDADDRTLKKAYKKQALKWHPDRHQGSAADKKKAEEKFKDIAHAYETLSEPEKRKIYDQFGEEGLKQGGGPGGPGGPGGGFQFHGDPFEMFNAFFGGGGGGQRFQFGGGGFPGGGGGGFQFQAGGGGGFPGGGQRMGGGQRQRGGGGGGGGGLYDDDSNIQTLDEPSFPSSSNGWVWLVEFYAPWCGHCQQLAPKWKKVAASLKGVVKVAAVNCDEHKNVCSKQGVRGYPTIKALSPGSTMWAEYQGDRSAASLSNWATSLIGNAAVNIKKQSDLDSFLAKCGSSGSSSKGSKNDAAAASWGLCVVLSSDKSSMPSLWKALSQAFKGKVALGFVGSSAQAGLAEKLGVTGKESKVVSICNGDLRTAEAFTGKLKSEPLQRHINTYAAGKKCAAQVVLDSSTDFTKMKVAQLKALVTAKGIDCSGCFEKGDYVAALKGWLEQQQGADAASEKPRIDEL